MESTLTLFPYSSVGVPSSFHFEGAVVLAQSSDEHVHAVQLSLSSLNNQTAASFNVTLRSQGGLHLSSVYAMWLILLSFKLVLISLWL